MLLYSIEKIRNLTMAFTGKPDETSASREATIHKDKLMGILAIEGITEEGIGHFTRRMKDYSDLFTSAFGHPLYSKGTLNVRVPHKIFIKEHFRILGRCLNEPEDFLIEICRANGVWAYRIRPYHPQTAQGGHGDDIIELVSKEAIPGVEEYGSAVKIEFLR